MFHTPYHILYMHMYWLKFIFTYIVGGSPNNGGYQYRVKCPIEEYLCGGCNKTLQGRPVAQELKGASEAGGLCSDHRPHNKHL